MKLVKMLAVATLGAFAAAGCTVTDSSSDGGTEGGTDTGTVVTDTGTAPTDTGTATDTAGETGPKCTDCQTVVCKTENDACSADTACVSEFNTALDCVKTCGTDKDCINKKCFEPMKNAKAIDAMTCIIDCLGICTK